MSYFDVYMTPVPEANKAQYRALAEVSAAVLKEFGFIRVVECWSDPASASPDTYHATEARQDAGAYPTFASVAGAKPGEIIIWSWAEWPDKASRDAGMERALADPRMLFQDQPQVFDPTRLVAGGFVPLLDYGSAP